MNPFTKVALAAVAVVAIVGGGFYLLSPGTQVGGPTPAPTTAPASAPPSPAPQGAVPADWTTHTSSRFAYSIDYPTAWVATPATQDWPITGIPYPDGKAVDKFYPSPTSTTWVFVSSVPVSAADPAAGRLAEMDRINAGACQTSNRHDVTVDGVTGRQEDTHCFGSDYLIETYMSNEDRFYQVVFFSATPLGATDRATYDRFLSSFRLAAPALAWQTFTSDRFGYTVELPGEWEITTPADDLPDHLYPGPETDYGDRWDPPVTRSPWFIVAVIDPAPEETVEDWVARYNADLASACSALVPEPIEVDGEAGTLRAGACLLPGVDLVDVLVVHGGRAYTITIAGASRDATTNRAIFDQILASFRFTS